MKKFKDLKVGDIVVEHIPNDRRHTPKEVTVSKIGKKYFYVHLGYGPDKKYNIETGYAEYGYEIFPGTLEEYNVCAEENRLLFELKKTLEQYNVNFREKHLTKDQIERIKMILNEE